ncbi:MAG: VWA domain-containing protein [Planctomycetota bacterium]
MITFALPWAFALLALPIVLRLVAPPHRETSRGLYSPDLVRLARLSGATASPGAVVRRRSALQWTFVALTWALFVGALAGPRLVEPPITKVTPTRDVLLALDLSGSMAIEDLMDAAGEPVDRLSACKGVLDEFLARREGDRVGLVLFGSAAFVQAPFTEDLDVCRALLDEAEVAMTGPKTVIGDAIGLSIGVFDRSELEDKVLILLTDGNDTGSRVPPTDAAKIAAERGIVIHVVAVGDPEGAGEQKLDEETLQAVASETGGAYLFAADRDELESVYDRLDAMSTREIESVSYSPTRELFAWPLGIALGLSVLFFLAADLAWSRRRGLDAVGLRVGAAALLVVAVLYVLVESATPLRFLRPFALLALPLGAALVRRAEVQSDPLGDLRGFMDPHLLAALELEGGERKRLRPVVLLAAVWLVGFVALAGPAWDREPPPFQEESAAFVVALEVTPTMLARDVQPSRLERATMKVMSLLEQRSGSRAALVAYAGSAHLVSPLTRDHEVFAPFLTELSPEIMPADGDSAARAVEVAARHLESSGFPGSVLLVTDGVLSDETEVIRGLRERGGPPVHVWGIAADASAPAALGGPPAPPLDAAALRAVASAGGGSMTAVRPDDKDVDRVAARLESALVDARTDDASAHWKDRGRGLVPLLVLLAMFWFRPGWVVRRD